MSRTTLYRTLAAAPFLLAFSLTGACSEPADPKDTSSVKDTSVVVPKAGVETHVFATKTELDCLEGCTPVLFIDVKQFPDSVNGLQIETNPIGQGVKAKMIQKHFKSHDGGGSFMVPLDKTELVNGYDLKIKPIYKTKQLDDQASTLVNEIKVEAIRNTTTPK